MGAPDLNLVVEIPPILTVFMPQLLSLTHSVDSTRPLFPKFDDTGGKFATPDAGAAAGFWPHLKQGLIAAEQVPLRDLARSGMRPLLGCHSQQLQKRSDIFVVFHA